MTEQFLATVAKALGRMRRTLCRIDQAPRFPYEPFATPYVNAFRRLAEERGLDATGIEAGEKFAKTWDERSRDFIERRTPRLQLDEEDELRMLEMLQQFGLWVGKNFPE